MPELDALALQLEMEESEALPDTNAPSLDSRTPTILKISGWVNTRKCLSLSSQAGPGQNRDYGCLDIHKLPSPRFTLSIHWNLEELLDLTEGLLPGICLPEIDYVYVGDHGQIPTEQWTGFILSNFEAKSYTVEKDAETLLEALEQPYYGYDEEGKELYVIGG
jgi:hypothetical protein